MGILAKDFALYNEKTNNHRSGRLDLTELSYQLLLFPEENPFFFSAFNFVRLCAFLFHINGLV